MESNLEKIIEHFNSITLTLFNTICNNKHGIKYKFYKNWLEEKLDEEPEYIFYEFMKNVYSDKTRRNAIMKGNDEFFMKKIDEKKNKKEKKEKNIVNELINIKKIYEKLNETEKNSIRISLIMMIECCENFIYS
jgi:Lhr-like helicase